MNQILRGPAADLIVAFVRQVGELANEMTFCGGNAAQLLITDPASVRVRPTDDIDVIVAITSATAYDGLRERLRQRGVLVDAREGAPVCRFRMPDGLPVDVMPTGGHIAGLRVDWFNEAVETAQRVTLTASTGERAIISLISAPAFLALKWSAYKDRGNDDPLMSRDFEDILTVVAGRPSIVAELVDAPADVRAYVAAACAGILRHPDLRAAIEDAIPDARIIRGLSDTVEERLRALTNPD